jgi:predicted Zn-dependent protease
MIEKLKDLIGKTQGVADWKIVQADREGLERYYLGKRLDMARGTRERECELRIFSDCDSPQGRTRGGAACFIRSGMSDSEISKALERCAYSASRAQGPWYPLLEPNVSRQSLPLPPLASGSMEEWSKRFAEAFYAEDSCSDPRINSLELFIKRCRKRIVNSRGLDEEFETARANCEYIVQAGGATEGVELFHETSMGVFDEAAIRSDIARQLKLAGDRASAEPANGLGSLKGLPVILSGAQAVSAFFGYFMAKTNARAVFEKTSEAAPGYRFCPEGADRDAVTLTLMAFDQRIPDAEPVDSDGLRLGDRAAIEAGKVASLYGEAKYCHFLGLPPKGGYGAARVSGGALSAAELRRGPYIECVSFSDFTMDPTTGDFGGEVRLGYLSDGKASRPFSGGAISGRMGENLASLRFSKETALAGNMMAPECVKLFAASASNG